MLFLLAPVGQVGAPPANLYCVSVAKPVAPEPVEMANSKCCPAATLEGFANVWLLPVSVSVYPQLSAAHVVTVIVAPSVNATGAIAHAVNPAVDAVALHGYVRAPCVAS
jgi:hypothetical protein